MIFDISLMSVTPQIHLNVPYTFLPNMDHHMGKLCSLLYHDELKVWLYFHSCIVLYYSYMFYVLVGGLCDMSRPHVVGHGLSF